jgi:acyl-coenzyme A thioesterase PaaI-like protein
MTEISNDVSTPADYSEAIPHEEPKKRSPFFEHVARPYFLRRDGFGLNRYHLRISDLQINSANSAHGGFIATLFDHLMGGWVRQYFSLRDDQFPSTQSLNIEYPNAAKLGELIFLTAKQVPQLHRNDAGKLIPGEAVCVGEIHGSDADCESGTAPMYAAKAVYVATNANKQRVRLRIPQAVI